MLKESRVLFVNKIFGPTHQGEGPTAGKLTMFLRLYGCNMACGYCDTPKTWNTIGSKFRHPEKHDIAKENHRMSLDEIVEELKRLGPGVTRLVISGGEPMLQEKNLIFLIRKLRLNGYKKIEIETNGTIKPSMEFVNLVDQFNCSPKTSNSGPDNKPKEMEVPEALTKLASFNKTVFKFVVEGRKDLPEIEALVEKYRMRRVVFMPMGRTKEELSKIQTEVARCAIECRCNYSPRLQVDLWDNAEDK